MTKDINDVHNETMSAITALQESILKSQEEDRTKLSEHTEKMEQFSKAITELVGTQEQLKKEREIAAAASEIMYKQKDAATITHEFNVRHRLAKDEETAKRTNRPLQLSVEEYKRYNKLHAQATVNREQVSGFKCASWDSDDAKFWAERVMPVANFTFQEAGITGADGGLMLPEPQAQMIDEEMRIRNPMRQEATVMTTNKQEEERVFAYDASSAGGWLNEGQNLEDQGTPQFGRILFKPKKLGTYWGITEEIDADAIVDLEAWNLSRAPRVLSEFESEAFTTGNGDNDTPIGILSCTKTSNAEPTEIDEHFNTFHTHKSDADGDFAADTDDDKGRAAKKLVRVVCDLKSAYLPNAKWFCSRLTLFRLLTIQDGEGRFINYNNNDMSKGMPMTILGHPVVTMDFFPHYNETAAYALAFGDMKQAYLIYDRMGYMHLRNPYIKMHSVMHYIRKRTIGKPFEGASMRLIQFSA